MKTLQEQIKVMQHYANGGEIEIIERNIKMPDAIWIKVNYPCWNWDRYDFRIKKQKKTVTIEKWLMEASDKKSNFIMECDDSYFENYYTSNKKVKLLDTYEVEL